MQKTWRMFVQGVPVALGILVLSLGTMAQTGETPASAPAPGTPWAWGDNYFGQLGDGNNAPSNVPIQSPSFAGATAIAAGGFHSLALESDATLWAWGYNHYGELGNGTDADSNIPVQVPGLTNVTAAAGGYYHSLALKQDSTVWAWGHNGYGQLGNGTYIDTKSPVAVLGLTGVTAISGGGYHSLALKNDGTVWAWGYNIYGQLGNGTTTTIDVPMQVSGLTDVRAIAGGYEYSLALKNDGTVWAWGYNFSGQLGDGTTTTSLVPVQVSGLTDVNAIAAGSTNPSHSLALKHDGTVWAWGSNGYGQLGNGTFTDSHVPVPVYNLTGVWAIACGGNHSLALMYDSALIDFVLAAWGDNLNGQLGNGTTTNSNVPWRVSILKHVTAISGGVHHSLASVTCPTLLLLPGTLPVPVVGSPYSQAISVTPVVGSYTYAVASGTLPQGLSLTDVGLFSGTPTMTGTWNFTLTATDTVSCTGSRYYSVYVVCPDIALSPSSLPGGHVGVAYSQTITATGPDSPVAFAVSSGFLPTGLTLTSGGALTGTPTATGSFIFTVTANSFGCEGSRVYGVDIVACPTITLSPPSLPNGAAGSAYSQTIAAGGGTAPYTLSVTSGSLPAGLTLSAAGLLSGTLTTAGVFNFTVAASEADACTGSRAYAITVVVPPVITLMKKAAPPYTIVVTGSNLQNGIQAYISGTLWPSVLWKTTGKIKLTGGASLKAVAPPNSSTHFRFVNPDGGEATATWP